MRAAPERLIFTPVLIYIKLSRAAYIAVILTEPNALIAFLMVHLGSIHPTIYSFFAHRCYVILISADQFARI